MRIRARAVLVVVAFLVAAAGSVLGAGGAQASSYRYWTYWWGSGSGSSAHWSFAQAGPAYHAVHDQSVLGWRFETSTSTTGGSRPRQSADFATLCPSLADPVSGQDRVALVLDYGTTSDAPPGQTPPSTSTARVECLTLAHEAAPNTATGMDVLNAAGVSVRIEGGLICGLDGYPVGECAPVIPDPAPTATRTTTSAPKASSSASPRSSSAGTAAATSATKQAATPTASPSGSAGTAAAVAPSTTSTPPSPAATTDDSGQTLAAAAGAPVTSRAGPGSPFATVLGVLAVAGLAGSAFWMSRRGRRGV